MPTLARFVSASSLGFLLLAAPGARADIKVDVSQDTQIKLWRYQYVIQHDDAIRQLGPGDVEEIELTTRDLMGVDVPIMALLPDGTTAAPTTYSAIGMSAGCGLSRR
jgi:hypothetical protein